MTRMIAGPDVDVRNRVASAWSMLNAAQLDQLIDRALAEDLGHGDITTALTIDSDAFANAVMVTKRAGAISGLRVAARVFARYDPDTVWTSQVEDGDRVESGEILATVTGAARSILTAERVALNLMQRMSGIATLTAEFVSAVSHTRARILDTRKTVPGLRALDRYAVVCGGGFNHRFGLSDGILIKDNHIQAAGGIDAALRRARGRPHGLRIEIEVETMPQLEEALAAGAEVILLDNMTPAELRHAVVLIGGRAMTEASGGVNLDSVAPIAESGVDLISVGQLTHSAPALDISLEIGL